MTIEECATPRQPRPFPDTPSDVFSQLRLDGKVAAVTGAADGIGFAAVEAFIEAGAKVAMVYRSNEKAATEKSEAFKKAGHEVRIYKCDGELRSHVAGAISIGLVSEESIFHSQSQTPKPSRHW